MQSLHSLWRVWIIHSWQPNSHVDFEISTISFTSRYASTTHLSVRGLPDVEQFTLEREDAVAISADHSQPTHGQSFGRVALRQDQCAVLRVARAGVVGVLQLRDAWWEGQGEVSGAMVFLLAACGWRGSGRGRWAPVAGPRESIT